MDLGLFIYIKHIDIGSIVRNTIATGIFDYMSSLLSASIIYYRAGLVQGCKAINGVR